MFDDLGRSLIMGFFTCPFLSLDDLQHVLDLTRPQWGSSCSRTGVGMRNSTNLIGIKIVDARPSYGFKGTLKHLRGTFRRIFCALMLLVLFHQTTFVTVGAASQLCGHDQHIDEHAQDLFNFVAHVIRPVTDGRGYANRDLGCFEVVWDDPTMICIVNWVLCAYGHRKRRASPGETELSTGPTESERFNGSLGDFGINIEEVLTVLSKAGSGWPECKHGDP
ncbi:hypothetical protein K438DRAFT_1763920 [Mycena galopus ATCC 62051]|nr:hypothetical protein K438DRAFT_1763920 [Mycena galopus ATCC 62051]